MAPRLVGSVESCLLRHDGHAAVDRRRSGGWHHRAVLDAVLRRGRNRRVLRHVHSADESGCGRRSRDAALPAGHGRDHRRAQGRSGGRASHRQCRNRGRCAAARRVDVDAGHVRPPHRRRAFGLLADGGRRAAVGRIAHQPGRGRRRSTLGAGRRTYGRRAEFSHLRPVGESWLAAGRGDRAVPAGIRRGDREDVRRAGDEPLHARRDDRGA